MPLLSLGKKPTLTFLIRACNVLTVPGGLSKQTVPDPECGTTLEHEGGCNVCRVCGYSKCL